MCPSPTLPKTMLAWRKHRTSPTPRRDTIPLPLTPPSGFLLKILAAGVCHSDVGILAADPDRPRPPYYNEVFTLGHEGCGEIVAIGGSIPVSSIAAGLRLGDRVAVNPVAGCDEGDCPDCTTGFPQLCVRRSGSHHGLGQDGMFAPYVAVSHRAVVKVPEGVSSAAAAVCTDAVMTSHHAVVTRAGVKKGDVVFVFGLGGLGLNALQILLARGCEVYVSDVRQGPLDEAVTLGVPASHVVPVDQDVRAFVLERGLDNKIDIVADFAGAQQTFSDAEVIVRRGGTILSIGLLAHEHKTNHALNITKAITILYTFGGQTVDIEKGLQMIAAGTLVPHVDAAPMANFPQVLGDLHEGKVRSRMVLVPEGVEGGL